MHRKILASICLVLSASAGVAVAETDTELRADSAASWPMWSGPQGDLTSPGQGMFGGDAFGLERVWTRPLGSGYSGIVVDHGRLVTTFSDGESDFLVALDPSSGAETWRYRISETYKGHDGSDDGPLSTPTLDDDTAYGLGARGELFAVSLSDGTPRWRRDLVADFGAVKPHYGFTTAPLVAGELLVVEAGGTDGRAIVALDRATGELRWSTGDDSVRYQSPMALDLEGETTVVAITDRHLLGLAPETGEELWRFRHTEGDARGFGVAQPVPVGEGGILLTGDSESVLFKVRKGAEGYTVDEAWRSRALRGSLVVPVPFEGHIYGYSGNFLTCIDAATGERAWRSRPPGEGELILADGRLVILARTGELVIAQATPDAYLEVTRVQALDRGYFTRPSVAGGKIYARNLTDIAAIAVTAASASARSEKDGAWELHGDFGAFIEELATVENKRERVERFLAEHKTLPILEGNWVHFVYHGEVEDLAISGNFIRDGSEQPMHRVDGTNLYFRSYELPASSVFSYRFSVFDEKMTDPANPRKIGTEDDESSVVATAGWQAPAHLREPEGPRGTLETLPWKSEQLSGDEREVQVYLPPGYDENEDRYPLLLVNDCDHALTVGKLDKSLDNLIGKTVAPMIAAFVCAPWPELGGSRTAEYARAQVEELIPLIDRTFRTDARRESRAVMGQSLAHDTGFAAMYLALHHPETVSRAAAQSFRHGQLKDDLLAAASGEKHDLELVFHWSTFDRLEPGFGFDSRGDAEGLVEALRKNGYRPTVFESHDGAGWGMWQGRMAEVLETLFPSR